MKQIDLETVRKTAYGMQPWLTEVRRDFHSHPELGDREFRTGETIAKLLAGMGIEFYRMENSTALVGLIRGARAGKTVAIRADMDALPIQEENDVPYRSQNDGVMHACGHDAHMAILLGTARLFAGLRESLCGNIRLLFQPAEETTGGAEKMVAAGCMKNPDADYVIGLHVGADLPAGTAEIPYHVVNGSSDMYRIVVHGRQAHGAYPEYGTDAVVIAAQVVTALQTIVSRNVSALDSAVFTLGTIHGGSRQNIIAGKVAMEGTLRTADQQVRLFARKRVEEIAKGVASAMGGSADVYLTESYMPLVNTDFVAGLVKEEAEKALGPENVVTRDRPSLGVEDFTYFLDAAPGAFYHLGCGNKERGICRPAHSSRFDIDESCLPVGVMLHALTALRLLETNSEH